MSITTEELESFVSAVKTRFGIDFTSYEMKSLKRGFERLLQRQGMRSLFDLWKKLLEDRHFIVQCIDELTVNMTDMFRNPEIWIPLREEIRNQFGAQDSLKIWHAGCSTGEEVYSMAFLLQSLNYTYKSEVLATDLNTSVLGHAENGACSKVNYTRYKDRFEKAFPGESIETLLEPCELGKFKFKNRLKRNVSFEKHNLVNQEYPKQMDIIFCRNVMIYFDERLKWATLKKLHESLNSEGLLIVGFYDAMPKEARELFDLHLPNARVYKKH